MASLMAAAIALAGLTTEYRVDPIGIDVLKPRLSWQLKPVLQNSVHEVPRRLLQSAYRIQIATDMPAFDDAPVWDSGRVESAQSVLVPYGGPELESGVRYYWRVRVWIGGDEPSAWSEPAFWEMGLLDPDDWTARWIAPGWEEDLTTPGPAPLLRHEFLTAGGIRRARLYVTSLGLYEMHLNGVVVGDQAFTPGWTSYNHRLQYQTYDVTDQLRAGSNTIGAWLGDGWYRGHLRWDMRRNVYGNRLALLAQLEIEYTDGTKETIVTNDDWVTATGAILTSDLYLGEIYDATLEGTEQWSPVDVIEHPRDILVASASAPVRRTEILHPVEILVSPNGNPIVDMGQNMVGRMRIRVRAPRGTTIVLRHAEVLNSDGSLYTDNLRHARQEIRYTAAGRAEEVYEPKFTFHGFRYVEIEGWPGTLNTDDVRGVVIHSDLDRTGVFETSNEMLNRLQSNIVWGQRGNFLDVPTDCPQRDERLGWTGDAQVFAPTAAFNMRVAPFFAKWLADLEADQLDDGSVPWVIPDVLVDDPGSKFGHGATGWGDAAVVVPWVMYEAYGDTTILAEQFDSMRRWVEFMRMRAGADLIWDGDDHFGDWLAFSPSHPGYPGATTSKDLIATAYFARSTDLLSRAARVIDRLDHAHEFESLFGQIREAYQSEFITQTGRLASETQTAYLLTLSFDLAPESLRQKLVERLVADIRSVGHMTTGFLGTPLLLHVLSENGELELAYELLLREEYPSWLYPVASGATTIWERWDSRKPDGSFQDPGMNSFNHYAYGAVGDWMYRVIGGINPDAGEPGYRHVVIHPRPAGGPRFARTSLETMYGEIRSEWEMEAGAFRLDVTIPPNTRATIIMPDGSLDDVIESGQAVTSRNDMSIVDTGHGTGLQVGSGEYQFTKN